MAIDLLIDKEALLQGALWGEGQHDRLAELSDLQLVQQRAEEPAPGHREGEGDCSPKPAMGRASSTSSSRRRPTIPTTSKSAQIMLEWFKEAGVNMKIEQLTWADWLSQVWVNKDFQISMMNFFTLWEPDFLYYSLWNSTGAFNYRKIKDPIIDDLTAKGAHHHRSGGAGRHLQTGAAADLRPDA